MWGGIKTKEDDDGLRIAMKPTVSSFTPEGLLIETEYVDGYSVPDDEYWDALSKSNRRIRESNLIIKNGDAWFDIPKFLRKYAD